MIKIEEYSWVYILPDSSKYDKDRGVQLGHILPDSSKYDKDRGVQLGLYTS